MSDNFCPDVLCFGEVLWDLLPDGPVLGGAPANLAYRLQELGSSVGLISRVGADKLGQEILQTLNGKHLPINLVQTDNEHPTGTVEVTLGPKGDAHYRIIPEVAYDYIECDSALLDAASKCKAICYGTLVQRSLTSRNTLYQILEAASSATKLVDINLRKDCFCRDTVHTSLQHANILKLNRDEVIVLSQLLSLNADSPESFAKKVIDNYEIALVLVTCGSDGVIAFDDHGLEIHVEGYNVSVVDTVGSGDNFTAGFLYKLLNGDDLETSCTFGNKVGALVASKKGGMPLVTIADLNSLPETTHSRILSNG
jgi:fructokinase